MFRFDFDLEEAEEELASDALNKTPVTDADLTVDNQPVTEHQLADLLDRLPSHISYSSIQAGDLLIPRRELFDVRMQLIASENDLNEHIDGETRTTLEYVSRPSDLVPRVYEGGLKTWECSLDLAQHVVRQCFGRRRQSERKVLELGCGTAMPSLAILQSLFDQDPPSDGDPEISVHLQDYNASVLEHVTLPNIVLVWFFSKAGEQFRATVPPPSPNARDGSFADIGGLALDSVPEENEADETQSSTVVGPSVHHFDLGTPGDLALSPTLRSAFTASVQKYRINVRLFSGSWDSFRSQNDTMFDLVLTSETIYQPASLPSLVRLLRDTTGTDGSGVCLVAAKLVYFGVGGGVREFERALEQDGVNGKAETVWEHRDGVGRNIMKVCFS